MQSIKQESPKIQLTGTRCEYVLRKMKLLGVHNYYAPKREGRGLWVANKI